MTSMARTTRSTRIFGRILSISSFAFLATSFLLCSRSIADARSDAEKVLSSISWQVGPCTVNLGSVAELTVPAGFRFTGPDGAEKWARLTQNPPDKACVGILIPDSSGWYLMFDYDNIGYVPDDEKNKLDADAILTSVREGTAQANAYRKSQGWSELQVLGWEQTPRYDTRTNNLVWAIRGSGDGETVINYNTRLLGRSGVMAVNLIDSPQSYASVVPTVNMLLSGFQFKQGQRYAEWRKGDKVAAYGLTALITGTAAAVAAKSGLLAKMMKGVAVAAAAFLAWLGRVFFGKDKSSAR